MMNFNFRFKYFLSILIIGIFCISVRAHAFSDPTIYLETNTDQVGEQSELSVSVLVDTSTSINAADLQILYPADKLEFLGFNNAKSIISFWQNSPSLLTKGHIQLTGGILQQFKGEKGLIVNLTFKALKVGDSVINFERSNLYLADGKGTKISANYLPVALKIISSNSEVKNETSVLPVTTNMKDVTPPVIFLQFSKKTDTSPALVVFDAKDQESGIKSTEIRFKKWFKWSNWQLAENPILYPAGVWDIELKAINNSGLESVKNISIDSEVVKKIFSVCVVIFLLIISCFLMYNKNKRKINHES